MIGWLLHLIGWTVNGFRSRENLLLENLALRQQLLALHSHRPRSRLSTGHKLFWVVLRGLWSGWKRPLVLVTPKTRWWLGSAPAFACTGDGSREPDEWAGGNL